MAETTYGTLIRTAREAAHMTQDDLADRLGISTTTVSNWERAVRPPGLEMVNALCAAIAISPDALLRAAGINLTPPSAARLPKMLTDAAIELDPEHMDSLVKTARGLLALQRSQQ